MRMSTNPCPFSATKGSGVARASETGVAYLLRGAAGGPQGVHGGAEGAQEAQQDQGLPPGQRNRARAVEAARPTMETSSGCGECQQILHVRIVCGMRRSKLMGPAKARSDLQASALACSPDSCSGACTRRASRRHCRAASAQDRAPGRLAHGAAPECPGPCAPRPPVAGGEQKGVSTRRAGKKSSLPRGEGSTQGMPAARSQLGAQGPSGERG